MYEPVLYHAVSFHENVFVVVVIHWKLLVKIKEWLIIPLYMLLNNI
jgi:hypothetical protein